jgi:hypothetical protein
LSDSVILSIAEDGEGGLWLGTYRSGAMRLARNGLVTYQESDGLGTSVGAVANVEVFDNGTGKTQFALSCRKAGGTQEF